MYGPLDDMKQYARTVQVSVQLGSFRVDVNKLPGSRLLVWLLFVAAIWLWVAEAHLSRQTVFRMFTYLVLSFLLTNAVG